MPTSIIVNLPVKDLKNSMQFYEALGYKLKFADERSALFVISDTIHVMVLTHAKFKEITSKEIADASKVSEALFSLSCENRESVDDLVALALAAGGSVTDEPQDYGFMYQHGFHDPDGHLWGVLWMNPAATE